MKHTSPVVELLTPRLWMRPFAPEDLDEFCRLYSDSEVMRYMGLRNRDETAALLAAAVDHWRRHGFGIWALLERETGRFVGRCGVRHASEAPDVELSYTMHGEFWGRGIATEAARASLRFGFEAVGLSRIIAFTDPDNRASMRVLEKLGMRYETRAPYRDREHVWYAISRAEYAAQWPTT